MWQWLGLFFRSLLFTFRAIKNVKLREMKRIKENQVKRTLEIFFRYFSAKERTEQQSGKNFKFTIN